MMQVTALFDLDFECIFAIKQIKDFLAFRGSQALCVVTKCGIGYRSVPDTALCDHIGALLARFMVCMVTNPLNWVSMYTLYHTL